MEVAPNVHSLHVDLDWFPQPYPPNVHLIVSEGEGALIDAGFPDDKSISARLTDLTSFDLKLRYIVITHHHFDHSSGARRLRDETGGLIVMHKDEAPLLHKAAEQELPSDVEIPEDRKEFAQNVQEFRAEAAKATADELVEDGHVLRLGALTLKLVHTPGHTAGHISPFLEDGRVLFAGDNVLGLGTTVVPPPPHGDMGTYIQSLNKMRDLNADVMCCGHGPAVKEPNRKLQELIDHRFEREEQILAILGNDNGSVKALVASIYPELDKRLAGMAASQVRSHLAKLEHEGRVRTKGEGDEMEVTLA
jgi:glyoxylase-like metal-dependent hydrolase (beta-lactamase superfamily II)